MSRTSEATAPPPAAASDPDAKRRARLDALLDEGLKDSFPASDPPAVTKPAATLPDDPPRPDRRRPRQ